MPQVASYRIRKLKEKLAGQGFERGPEGNHGREFWRRLLPSEREQLHVKVMPNGWIEAEIEPPPECPLAHINQRHRYSAHRAVAAMLGKCEIRFRTAHDVPPACLDPLVDRPSKPAHWKVLAGAFALAATVFVGALALNKLRS